MRLHADQVAADWPVSILGPVEMNDDCWDQMVTFFPAFGEEEEERKQHTIR